MDVETEVECVNAKIKIEGGLIAKKKLSSKELQERKANIEACKKLLH